MPQELVSRVALETNAVQRFESYINAFPDTDHRMTLAQLAGALRLLRGRRVPGLLLLDHKTVGASLYHALLLKHCQKGWCPFSAGVSQICVLSQAR